MFIPNLPHYTLGSMEHRGSLCVVFASILGLLLFPLVVSNSFGGVSPDLTISKVGPPGKVEMSDDNGPVKKKTLNDGDIVRICNNLQNGNNVVLTVRDKNGMITHQQIIGPHQCVDLVVGSAQLPSGANYKVSGGSFINLDGISGNTGEAVFELDSPVGGTIIPIDTTSLLLAGAQMNAAWLIPAMVSAIGIGIILARKY